MLCMVAYSHRPQRGPFMCYLDRTYHVLLTLDASLVAIEVNPL